MNVSVLLSSQVRTTSSMLVKVKNSPDATMKVVASGTLNLDSPKFSPMTTTSLSMNTSDGQLSDEQSRSPTTTIPFSEDSSIARSKLSQESTDSVEETDLIQTSTTKKTKTPTNPAEGKFPIRMESSRSCLEHLCAAWSPLV